MTLNPAATNWRSIGDVSLAAIKQELWRVSSPMLDDIDATWKAAQPHTGLFFAQAWKENQYETTGILIKPEHHNPVGLRPERIGSLGPYGYGLITAPDGGQFLVFRSDADCAREWKRRLVDEATTYKSGVYAATTTLEELLAVYTPAGDIHPVTGVDNRDINYAATVRTVLNRYAALEAAQGNGDTPMATPTIIDKWLHVTQSGYAGVVRYSSRTMSPKAIFVHIQEGSNWGSWQWFHNPDVLASSTVMIGKNGDIWRLVPEDKAPWTNGDVKSPTARGVALLNAYGWDPNRYSLTIECEGFTGQPVPEAQMNSIVWQIEDWQRRYGLDDDDVYRHADVNSVTRPRCPGDALFAEVKRRLGTGAPAPTPVPTTSIAIGDTVKATDILNVRQGSAMTYPVKFQLQPGDQVTIKDGPRIEDGYTWYDVVHPVHGSGWAVVNWLEEVAPPPAPAPTPGPVFHPFEPHRTFTVGKSGATVRRYASRESEVLVLRVAPGTKVVATGYYQGESINGKNRWLVQRDEPRGRIHEGALVEAI